MKEGQRKRLKSRTVKYLNNGAPEEGQSQVAGVGDGGGGGRGGGGGGGGGAGGGGRRHGPAMGVHCQGEKCPNKVMKVFMYSSLHVFHCILYSTGVQGNMIQFYCCAIVQGSKFSTSTKCPIVMCTAHMHTCSCE